MKLRLLLILVLSSFIVSGQTVEARLAVKKEKQLLLLQQLDQLDTEIEALKFEQIQEDLRSVGLPVGEQI
jgi:cell division protein FtsL